eukprot:TRINITY_DN31355_c0_g1_i1.p1 TRINITY_DN31355_c0_g1~~TRINITY_DN31355_c0_g1_i1.p1  ORF type:complete len:481 (-),score=84.85 TRINITY_DN31355_c0_g1_i1:198-1577(-)
MVNVAKLREEQKAVEKLARSQERELLQLARLISAAEKAPSVESPPRAGGKRAGKALTTPKARGRVGRSKAESLQDAATPIKEADASAKNAEDETSAKPLDRGESGCIEESQADDAGKIAEKSTSPKGGKRKAASADVTSEEAAKREKKVKPEGPYSKYKDIGDGAIPEPELARIPVAPESNSMKVVSWNVGGLRAFVKGRLEDLKEVVRRETPDVLGILEHKLQEGDTETTIATVLEALPDYTAAAVNCSTAKKGYSGTVVFLRKDSMTPLSVQAYDLPSALDEGRLISVEYEAFVVVLAYVPNSGDGLKRLDQRVEQWDKELLSNLSDLAQKKPVMLIGDLNVAHLDIDIWNVEAPHVPKSASTTPQERESFGRLLDAGFVDGFRHIHPEAQGAFTYWSVRAKNRPQNRGLRLDYVVVSKDMVTKESANPAAPTLHDVFHLTDLCKGDHCCVGATLTL